MMPVSDFLSGLDTVRMTGPSRWLCRCPAHDDATPSLSVRELADGTLLVRCFGLCAVGDVLGAIGLDMTVLFPDGATFQARPQSRPFAAQDVLRALASEALIAATAASNVAHGIELSDKDRECLWKAAERLQSDYEVATGE